MRKLLEITPIESLELYHIWEQERAVSLLDEVARLTQHSTPGTMGVVLDLSGMSLRKHVNSDFLRFVKIVSAIDQDHVSLVVFQCPSQSDATTCPAVS